MAGLKPAPARPVLGVAMLDTDFPRPPGDIGNAASFDFPVLFHRVRGAGVARAVTAGHDRALFDGFLQAGRALRGRGATMIATSCGFLAPLQHEMATAIDLPVVTSVLVDLPAIRAGIGPDALIGILTFDARKLGHQHLPAEFGPYRIAGVERGQALYPVITNNHRDLDPLAAEDDVANAVEELLSQGPAPAVIVLECTNLPPYRSVIQARYDGPVFDIRNAISMRVANGIKGEDQAWDNYPNLMIYLDK